MANSNSIFQAARSAAMGNATTETEFTRADATTTINLVKLEGSDKANGKVIYLKASGKVNGGTTTNVTFNIYKGADKNGTKIATSGAIANNNTAKAWFLAVEAVSDSTGKSLGGIQYGIIGNTAAPAQGALTSAAAVDTGTSPSTAATFLVSCQFSASSTTNTATMEDFSLEIF